MEPINKNWKDADDNHQGGISCGVGYTISWQRGSLLTEGRNGAFLTEVLESCLNQLNYINSGKFKCLENDEAYRFLSLTIEELNSRRNRRKENGTLGTHIPENNI